MTVQPTGPLAGVKVLEVAQVVAGPTCGFMLADLGAGVIKVERVPDGDDTRRVTPPEIDSESAAFMMPSRNKGGIALDLKSLSRHQPAELVQFPFSTNLSALR